LECLAVFDEVMVGVLECARLEDDGHFTMEKYVQSALGLETHHCLSSGQRATLSGSKLRPYLSFLARA